MLFESVHVLSQLARASQEFYPPLASAGVLLELRSLLYHTSATIRAKVQRLLRYTCSLTTHRLHCACICVCLAW